MTFKTADEKRGTYREIIDDLDKKIKKAQNKQIAVSEEIRNLRKARADFYDLLRGLPE